MECRVLGCSSMVVEGEGGGGGGGGCFFLQAEDGIRGLVRSRGLGDVYKGQSQCSQSQRAARPC